MKGGVEFFFTRHFQVVSPGDRRGVIPPQFFKDAVKVVTKTETFRPVADKGARDAYARGAPDTAQYKLDSTQ